MKFLFTTSFVFLLSILNAQISYVGNILDGTGFINQIQDGVELDNGSYVFASGNVWDVEPYVINSDGVSRIVDLISGTSGSLPYSFTKFKGTAYFVAGGDDGGGVYKTDGTAEGTVKVFGLSGSTTSTFDISDLIVTEDDQMYFSLDGNLYMFDGDMLTTIDYGQPIDIEYVSNYMDYSWCMHDEGVALINKSGNQAKLLAVSGTEVTELLDLPSNGMFDDYFGMESYDGNILFTVKSFDDDVEGNYTYDIANGNLSKIGNTIFPVRTQRINRNACVATNISQGTYFFDQNNKEGKEIYSTSPSLTSNDKWRTGVHKEGVIFEGLSGTFADTELVYYDIISGESQMVFSTDDMSDLVTSGLYTFFFADSETGSQFSDSDIFVFDSNSQEITALHTLLDVKAQDILPIKVINDELYFWADIEDMNGEAVYKYELGFTTSTNEIQSHNHFALRNIGNGIYDIQYDHTSDFNVDIYSISGELVSKDVVSNNNAQVEIPHNGVFIIRVNEGYNTQSFKVYVNKK